MILLIKINFMYHVLFEQCSNNVPCLVKLGTLDSQTFYCCLELFLSTTLGLFMPQFMANIHFSLPCHASITIQTTTVLVTGNGSVGISVSINYHLSFGSGSELKRFINMIEGWLYSMSEIVLNYFVI